MKNIHFLLTITRREDSESFVDFFNSRNLSCIYSSVAEGTARQKTLALLGLERSYKSIHCAVVPGSLTKEILHALSAEMQIDLPDRGVAIAVPIQSVSGSRTLQYLLSGTELSAVEGEPMQSDYELIIAILEAGYTDMVMDAAREGGAGGGTVVHAKGTGAERAQKFFGISLADEKDMLYIVTSRAKRNDIMRSIMQKAGIDSKAHTIAFSVPVAATAGFKLFDANEPVPEGEL